MAIGAGLVTGRTSQHVRHIGEMLRQGRNPAARVYASIGSDIFLAPAPGWLNLGLWEGGRSGRQVGDQGGGGLPVTSRVARLTFAVCWNSTLMNEASCARCAAVLGARRSADSTQTRTR
jgi:hypothetical protein